MIKKTLIASALMVFTTFSFAEQLPHSRGADNRIQSVNYNPDDVVRINARVGIATHIVLNPDEEYQTHAFGDSEAWNLAGFNNNIFIKPKVINGATNLVVITNKRTYNFVVDDTKKNTYQVKFNYPDEVRKKAELLAKANDKNFELNQLKNRFVNKTINLAYKMKGTSSIAPINVWDDGSFTYFKYGNNVDLPSIYVINDDGKEGLYNSTVIGVNNNIIMVHGISQKWRTRIGESALDFYNMALNKTGNDMDTGTIFNDVIREVQQ